VSENIGSSEPASEASSGAAGARAYVGRFSVNTYILTHWHASRQKRWEKLPITNLTHSLTSITQRMTERRPGRP